MQSKLIKFLFLIFLFSCAVKESFTPNSKITDFLARGRVAVNYPLCSEYRKCSQESLNASLVWEHKENNNSDSISLYDPTGQERAKIYWAEGEIIYSDKKGSQKLSQEELAQRLGFALPINDLRALFLGGEENNKELNTWQIKRSDWQKEGFFRKLSLKKDSYQIKLLISKIEI